MKIRSKLAWSREKKNLYWRKPLSRIKRRILILQMAEAMDEDVAEVATKITLKTLKKRKMKSLKINPRLLAITVKVKGTSQMNAESPRKTDKERPSRESTFSRGRKRNNSPYGYGRIG